MASKKSTKKSSLPQETSADTQSGSTSTITYANDVLVTICSTALSEVNGIASMISVPSGGLLGKGKTSGKGIKVEMGDEDVAIDLYLSVEYGTPIQQCAGDAQESVRRAIESMTGLKVTRVDVHVQGVSFEREKNALEEGSKTAVLTDGSETDTADEAQEAEKTDEKDEETDTMES